MLKNRCLCLSTDGDPDRYRDSRYHVAGGCSWSNSFIHNEFLETSAAAPTSTSTAESISPTQLTETTIVTVTQTTSTAVEVITNVTAAAESHNTGGIACDGRGVLIVHSVVYYGQDIDAEKQSTLAKRPGTRAVSPGVCSSLRAQVDDRTIWPIVINYGFDTSALCAATRELGGNPCTLNNTGDSRVSARTQ